MTRRRVAAVAVCLLLLAGCGKADAGGLPVDTAPVTMPSGVTQKQIDKALGDAGIVARPDDATAAAYVADLKKIDPEIVRNQKLDKLIDRGRNQCTSIHDWPDDHAKLVKLVNTRFTSPDHPQGFGRLKAAKILKVVHRRICPTY
jgi:hypothetical protein